MASKNENLNKAKKAKNDEFYTQYVDIEKEVQHYFDQLKWKRVYCPCDDYRQSNFVKYFKDNYEKIGLAGLIATNYDIGDGAWKYVYDGKKETISQLEGNGDFKSEECTRIKDDECDVVITNPPFSLFRDYVKQLMDYGKKFLIIGNKNAITYKEIFPYIKNNQLWCGVRSFSGGMWFVINDETDCNTTKVENNQLLDNVASCWFTNIPHTKRNTKIDLVRKYNETDFPKYDNYDAIEVSRVTDIPEDYNGVMGVPITFLDKYCPTQFQIVGCSSQYGDCGKHLDNTEWGCIINGKHIYKRLFIKRLKNNETK